MSNDLAGREAVTIWVCVNCIMHHANGECGDCHNPDGHEGGEPLNLLDPKFSAMGMGWEDHNEECHVFTSRGEDRDECDCETNTYSTSTCEGCGSTYHGERHAMTEWIPS